MTDHELLEAASSVYGIQINWDFCDTCFYYSSDEKASNPKIYWNPLTNDGDALRLAATLNIDVMQDKHEQVVSARCPGIEFDDDWIGEHWGNDKLAATRRAIVRAAASIGGAT